MRAPPSVGSLAKDVNVNLGRGRFLLDPHTLQQQKQTKQKMQETKDGPTQKDEVP